MKFIDPAHPMYRPLWVRLLIVGFSFGWALVELANGAAVWASLFAGIGAYAGWVLLVRWKDPAPPPGDPDPR
jgi:hypothetical protein